MSVKISPAERAFALSPDPANPNLPAGVVWKLLACLDGAPYLKVSCSYCWQTMDTTCTDPAKVVFKHCNVATENSLDGESRPPKELLGRMEKIQIKLGIRKKPTIMQRLTGETPSLVKAF